MANNDILRSIRDALTIDDATMIRIFRLSGREVGQSTIAALLKAEDEDGHIRVYPAAGISAEEIEEVEGKIASRCVDILVEDGVSICAAVYD